ncbi:MAG TPA: hypothetical protein VK822_02040 [Acetobacteraceae bacterium]|nr:hypothetical protein [Acetobacteraceae bacterium]
MANIVVMPAPRRRELAGGILAGMGPIARTLSLGAATVWLGTVPVASQSPAPQQVTSDTPEYCLHLLDRVSQMVRVAGSPPPQEVTFLSSEGQRMCDQGQTRGGILRLRRALMLMIHRSDGP